jgi:cysteine-S-conjugate beta-lyase
MEYNFDKIVDRGGTDSVKYDLRFAMFGTDKVIPLWVADMDFRAPENVINTIAQQADHGVYGYTILPKQFNDSIVEWSLKRYHWELKKNWITCCPGVVPSLAISILTFTRPGDKIIIQSPVYPPFFTIVNENDRELLVNELKAVNNRYEIDFDDLETKASQGAKMLILCNPHNPVGRVWTKNELQRVAEICLNHNIIMIADEIHADIVYSPNRYVPLASLSEEIANQTITCLAPSKTFNIAGLATSITIIANRDLNNRFKKQLAAMGLNHGSYFGPKALEAAYLNGEKWLDNMLDYVAKNIDLVIRYIGEHIPEIKVVKPEGTYLLWLDCKGLGMNDRELKRFMIHKACLGFNDGPTFGQGGSGFQRMNVACPASVLELALKQLKQSVDLWRETN